MMHYLLWLNIYAVLALWLLEWALRRADARWKEAWPFLFDLSWMVRVAGRFLALVACVVWYWR